MKNIITSILVPILTIAVSSANAQTLNWESLKKQDQHIVNINLTGEHGLGYGLGYGYQIKNKLAPALVNVEFSAPSGEVAFDEFKIKLGGQIRWAKYRNFQFSTRTYGVFRRYENDFSRLLNFGCDLSGVVGYYRPKWFAAAEAGFDKAIVTHFRHSKAYKEQYANAVGGWYQPATGGTFRYGLQAGFSAGRHDIYLRGGRVLNQDFKTRPTMPYYAQIGYNIRF
jgi:hypothetical protein